MAAMKIQDGALVTSCAVSRRLISGASFMFISSIVFRKWNKRPKKPSLNRVKKNFDRQNYRNICLSIPLIVMLLFVLMMSMFFVC